MSEKITELTKCYFWTWQLIIFSLENQYIHHTFTSVETSQEIPPCLWCSLLLSRASRDPPVGKAPELWVGSVQGGAEQKEQKRKLLDLLPVCDASDPMAARAGRWAACIQWCQLLWNSYGSVCLPKLPPDLKHPWEQARHCRDFGGFKSSSVQLSGGFLEGSRGLSGTKLVCDVNRILFLT